MRGFRNRDECRPASRVDRSLIRPGRALRAFGRVSGRLPRRALSTPHGRASGRAVLRPRPGHLRPGLEASTPCRGTEPLAGSSAQMRVLPGPTPHVSESASTMSRPWDPPPPPARRTAPWPWSITSIRARPRRLPRRSSILPSPCRKALLTSSDTTVLASVISSSEAVARHSSTSRRAAAPAVGSRGSCSRRISPRERRQSAWRRADSRCARAAARWFSVDASRSAAHRKRRAPSSANRSPSTPSEPTSLLPALSIRFPYPSRQPRNALPGPLVADQHRQRSLQNLASARFELCSGSARGRGPCAPGALRASRRRYRAFYYVALIGLLRGEDSKNGRSLRLCLASKPRSDTPQPSMTPPRPRTIEPPSSSMLTASQSLPPASASARARTATAPRLIASGRGFATSGLLRAGASDVAEGEHGRQQHGRSPCAC